MATAPALPTYDPVDDWDAGVRAYFEAAFGREHFAAMAAALMRPPLGTCLRVNPLRATPQSVIERLPGQLSAEDAAAMAASGQPPRELPEVPGAVLVPGSGPHKIDYGPAEGREVVISRKAGESVLRGAQPFVPGCLAATAGLEAGDVVAVSIAEEPPGAKWAGLTRGTTLPPGIAAPASAAAAGGGNGSCAAETAEAAEAADPVSALPDRRRLHIGLGRAMFSRGDLFGGRRGVGVQMTQRVFANPSCDGILRGEVMLQNLPSLVAAQALGPRPGARVLDLCAAPGGKTTALGQLMGDRGTIIALERSASKVPGVRAMAEEFGLTCIQAYRMDSTRAVLRCAAAEPAVAAPETALAAAGASGGSAVAGPAAAEPEAALAAEAVEPAAAANGAAAPAADVLGGAGIAAAFPEAAAGGCSSREAPLAAAVAARAAPPRQENEKQRARRERKVAGMLQRGLTLPAALLGVAPEPAARGFPPASFDAILLDGPCSALGLRPRLVHRVALWELAQMAEQQRRLIDAAAALLKPGGELVYSTCTINPGENEANVRYALDAYPALELVSHKPYIGGGGLVGSCECGGITASEAAAAAARVRRRELRAVAHAGSSRVSSNGAAPAPAANGAPAGRVAQVDRAAQVAAGPETVEAAAAVEVARQLVGRGLTAAEAALVQRFDPAGPRDTPGFFIAKFRKRL